MNIESVRLFAILLAPFAIAFLIEALVLYFYKLKGFWMAICISVLINLVTIAVIFYVVMAVLGMLKYEINGLHLPPQVVLFLWWFSSIAEGLLLQIFLRKVEKKRLFSASIIMNALSYLFLYLFIVNSH